MRYYLSNPCSFFLSLTLLAGCSATAEKRNQSTEAILSASGFHEYIEKHPDEHENLQNLPQRTLIAMPGAVKPTYVYVDHGPCDCVYVGGEKELQTYLILVDRAQKAAADLQEAKNRQNIASMGDRYGLGGTYGYGGIGVMGGYW
ncbi:MAG: hypothetical protein D4R76_02250 [Methylococcus sp.]|jgi:hypothetical protein|nr:MAG: hypothetical protein D4R76_02250 [Methylococcus sp.]